MSTDTPGEATTPAATQDSQGTQDDTQPTPGSDNDGAEAGYTPPSGSDDPVSD